MKNGGLAILMTGVAGLVGILAGLLLALAISSALNTFFQPDEFGISNATVIAFIVLPILGGSICITLCWRRVYIRTYGLQKDRKSIRCIKCGYILFKNRTKQCPECGQAIKPKQQKHLKRVERQHA